MLPLGMLAPDIVEAILAGHHPPELTASRLKRLRHLPTSWDEQRRVLGFELSKPISRALCNSILGSKTEVVGRDDFFSD